MGFEAPGLVFCRAVDGPIPVSAALRCWVLLATIAAFAAGCSSEYTVGEAAKQGYVSAEIETSSEREAAITLNVLAAGAGTFTVTIAAGTRLGSTNAAVQPLVTAQKIQFGFASAPSGASQTKRVETYCLN